MPLRLPLLGLCMALTACASTAPAPGGPAAWSAGADVQFDGRLTAVDTAPWAYDGNARLSVATGAHGVVAVELPARWNLCKAPDVSAAAQIPVGTAVRVSGRVQEAGTVVVCADARHGVTALP